MRLGQYCIKIRLSLSRPLILLVRSHDYCYGGCLHVLIHTTIAI